MPAMCQSALLFPSSVATPSWSPSPRPVPKSARNELPRSSGELLLAMLRRPPGHSFPSTQLFGFGVEF
eukprot:10235440-Alexandrium_andersonii.AAC.1